MKKKKKPATRIADMFEPDPAAKPAEGKDTQDSPPSGDQGGTREDDVAPEDEASDEPANEEPAEDGDEVAEEANPEGEAAPAEDTGSPDEHPSGEDAVFVAEDAPAVEDEPADPAAAEAPANRRFSDVLLDGAARIESAKRTGDRLTEAVVDFCRKALTKPEKLVATASTFLMEGFRDEIARIAKAVPEDFVLAAAERGSVDLPEALVRHWSKSDDRAISTVIDRVIAAQERFKNAGSAGFLVALARSSGVLKPVRASELLGIVSRLPDDEESRPAREEAAGIVAAGEFLRQNAPECRAFWRQRICSPEAGAAWDSAEAEQALGKLRACAGKGMTIPAAMLEVLSPELRESLVPPPPSPKAKTAAAKPEKKEEPPADETSTILPIRKSRPDAPDLTAQRPIIRPPSRNPARFVIVVAIASVILLAWILWPGAETEPPASKAGSTTNASSITTSPTPAPARAMEKTPEPPPAPAKLVETSPPPPVKPEPAPAMRAPAEPAIAPPKTEPPAPVAAASSTPPAPAVEHGVGLPQWRRDRIKEEIRKQPDVERWYRAVKSGTWESSRPLLAGDVSYLPYQSEAHRCLVTLCLLDPPANAEIRRALPRMAILTFPVADLVPLWEKIVADEAEDAAEVRIAAGLLLDVDQRTMTPDLVGRLKKVAGREK